MGYANHTIPRLLLLLLVRKNSEDLGFITYILAVRRVVGHGCLACCVGRCHVCLYISPSPSREFDHPISTFHVNPSAHVMFSVFLPDLANPPNFRCSLSNSTRSRRISRQGKPRQADALARGVHRG